VENIKCTSVATTHYARPNKHSFANNLKSRISAPVSAFNETATTEIFYSDSTAVDIGCSLALRYVGKITCVTEVPTRNFNYFERCYFPAQCL